MAKVKKVIKPSRKRWGVPARQKFLNLGGPAGVALILFFTLSSFFLPKNKFQIAKEQVLKNPKDLEAHLFLAEEFLKNNQLELAKTELLAAQQLQQFSSSAVQQSRVLGLTSKLEELWQNWREENPQELEKLISQWEKIVSETPTYRDGYLRLTLYYFKLGNPEKAKENLQKALELDPNFEPARELEIIIRE